MAGGEVIGAAIGVLLLILVGYIMVGSTLSSADIVTTAQKDVTLQNEIRLHTSIDILTFTPPPTLPGLVTFSVKNDGSEPINNLAHMDVFLHLSDNSGFSRFTYGNGDGQTWIRIDSPSDWIYPGETMTGKINSISIACDQIKVVTDNGVYDSI
jgi:hypothetical protein